MTEAADVWAVVPVKEFAIAKQRLSGVLTPDQRQSLAATMLEDVLDAATATSGLAGIIVATCDERASHLAVRYSARVLRDHARDGLNDAIRAACRVLAGEKRSGMLIIPGDVPLISTADISAIVATSDCSPAFSIVPSRDELGSNAIFCSPPDAVPLRFGEDSFVPHLHAARRLGIEPKIVLRPRVALDIDTPADLARFMAASSGMGTRTLAYLLSAGIVPKPSSDHTYG